MAVNRGSLFVLVIISLLLSECSIPFRSIVPTVPSLPPAQSPIRIFPTPIPALTKPLESITYRNLFQEYLGKSAAEVQEKLDIAWRFPGVIIL
jgi:hypothetical protein